MENLYMSRRVKRLKENALQSKRYASIEQARIITNTYKQNPDKSRIIQRALSLKNALENLEIGVMKEELIVGNRTLGIRDGVIFPESGSNWIDKEFESLPARPQDKFQVHKEDIEEFRNDIFPFWQGKSMEDIIVERYGDEINKIAKVVKINQKDHAQGHICPDVKTWLEKGPTILKKEANMALKQSPNNHDFYQSIVYVMEGVEHFMKRYYRYIIEDLKVNIEDDLYQVAMNCKNLSERPPLNFHEAVQSVWFLFVILHMESNASSFSPGRMDMYLSSFYQKDIEQGIITKQRALEIIECLWVKFNEIVYLRNQHSAKFFAGFPIGFNVALGGQNEFGNPYENELTYLFLKAQEHLGLPQPNISVRLHKKTSEKLLKTAIEVIAKGSGMPQFFNDEAIIQPMIALGIEEKDARDYAIVGCVELTTQGNNLGWSDAAMFNLNKVLELTLNNGKCLLTNKAIGLDLGNLTTYQSFNDLEEAFKKQTQYFIEKMITACEVVEHAHQDCLPTPFLSSVIQDCMKNGTDVTAGGAKYNLSGIQMIQVANLADSFAVLKQLVFDENKIGKEEMLQALQEDFKGHDITKAMIENLVPKYGNDVAWVDNLGSKWATFFRGQLRGKVNYRGGKYHTGMYTVSAHVPMGENVGASPDGRHAKTPLADGGMSPVYGRDKEGPTAVLKSVSRLNNDLTTNGGLLNMKFLPEFFDAEGINKFALMLRAFVDLEIPHIQFNVVRKEDLLAAQKQPELYRGLTIRVAGYTAYFVELASELQNEIIARISYGNI
ncbi:MAG: glycyl radical protein [Coprobacillaceae bacterium]